MKLMSMATLTTTKGNSLLPSPQLHVMFGLTAHRYGASETGSFISVLSSVRNGVRENGRLYPSYGKYEYGLPMDESELDRNQLQHHKFTLLLNHRLYLAPILDSVLEQPGSRVLDMGTGNGVWAIDMADKFPHAEIIGNDIAAVQPSFVPPNCIFEIEDVEEDWPYPRQYFDFIHGREFLYAIRDWPRLISQAHNALRPGGWIQLASSYPLLRSDDDTLPPNSALLEITDSFIEISEKAGASVHALREWKHQLTDAGFINVADVVLKIPMNGWPKDDLLRQVGELEEWMLRDGMESLMLRGWTQVLHRPAEDLALYIALAKKELRDTSVHSYIFFHITYGQRPWS